MVTIKDIARISGYNISTVSRALSGCGYARAETAGKIKKVADELGYIVNQSARQLRNGVSNTIGIIVSDINNPFYSTIISNIEQQLQQNGLSLLVTYSLESPSREAECLYSLMSAKVAAIIITPVTDKNQHIISKALQQGIRVIQLYRQVYNNIGTIFFDDEYGSYLATRHLIDKNLTRIALIDVHYEHIDNQLLAPSRQKGYDKAIQEAGLANTIYRNALIAEDNRGLTEFLVSTKPDGVITATSNFAIDVLNIAKIHNMNIDIVTFDDMDWISYLGISAIKQPQTEMSNCLMEAILSKDPSNALFCKVIKPSIVIRGNTQQ